jgi:hypothetical protein
MIYDAMRLNQADGVAICEAHEDLEVFRLRLGKAIDFEYMEDTQTSLFQRRDPREGGPRLDIERAMNKLEKVALRFSKRHGRPLVLIFNNIHFFKNDDESAALLHQLQQRAESWAGSGIATLVFSTDDFWPFPLLKKNGNRMKVVSIYDLDTQESVQALRRLRKEAKGVIEPDEIIQDTIGITGGRLSYLNRVARSPDMIQTAESLREREKSWVLSQIGLIPDCDDDVMDEQKWSSCSWLLLREFVKQRIELEKKRDEAIEAGASTKEWAELPLPRIPYWKCRQIMTRTDFIEGLDHLNIISIDINHDVRPDSMIVLQAAREVVEEEGFDEILDGVRDRIDEIESLHRTRELTFKDVAPGDSVYVKVNKSGGKWWPW